MRRLLLAGLLSASATTLALAEVVIPEGDAGTALRLTDSLEPAGRIAGLASVHGLAVTPSRDLLIAGSLAEANASGDAPAAAPMKPKGMAQVEHDAHHGGGMAGGSGMADAEASGKVSLVSLVSMSDGAVEARIKVPGIVHHVAADLQERYAVVTHPGLGSVSIIDLEERSLLGTIATGPNPNYAVADPETGTFLVSNAGNATISVVDPDAMFVQRNIKIASGGEHMVLSKDRIVVAEADAGRIAVIDLESGKTLETYEIGGQLHGVEVEAASGDIFASARERGKVVRIDGQTGEIEEAAPGPQPYHITLADAGLLVSSAVEPVVWVLDPDTLEVTSTIATSAVAHQMVVAAAD